MTSVYKHPPHTIYLILRKVKNFLSAVIRSFQNLIRFLPLISTRKMSLIKYLYLLYNGLNMTSNGNGSNNGEVIGGASNLRLDCSSAAGAPTLTTPTLTPTTLRNIEQMFLEASDGNNLEQPVVHENAAHFVPPPIVMELPSAHSSGPPPPPLPGPHSVKVPPPLPGPHMIVPDALVSDQASSSGLTSSQVPLAIKSEPQDYLMQQEQASTTIVNKNESKRNRNNNNVILETSSVEQDATTTSLCNNEEERKRQMRRLRNKEAAARCRKRRLDKTMSLQDEVDNLELVRGELQKELESLQSEKDKLKGILDLHQCSFETNKQPKLELS